MSDTWKRLAPSFTTFGGKHYAEFRRTDGRTKKVRLPDDNAEAQVEYADLSRRFLSGEYEPPEPERRVTAKRTTTTTNPSTPIMAKTQPNAFTWPIPLEAGDASLTIPSMTGLSSKDLEVLRLSLRQFGEMVQLLSGARPDAADRIREQMGETLDGIMS